MPREGAAKPVVSNTVDGSEIRQESPVEVGSVSTIIYQGFIHPRWLFGISSINSMNIYIYTYIYIHIYIYLHTHMLHETGIFTCMNRCFIHGINVGTVNISYMDLMGYIIWTIDHTSAGIMSLGDSLHNKCGSWQQLIGTYKMFHLFVF